MNELWIPFSFGFLQGFVSQIHCLGMCGPLIFSGGNYDKFIIGYYQMGRFLGYMWLGYAVYSLGESARKIGTELHLPYFALAILSMYILYIFFSRILGWNVPFGLLSKMYLTTNSFSFSKITPEIKKFVFGLTSVLLPCGVLYTMIAQAYAQSALNQSMILVFGFFLGTSPAILGMNKMQNLLVQYLPQAWLREIVQFGILLIGLGVAFYRSIVTQCH